MFIFLESLKEARKKVIKAQVTSELSSNEDDKDTQKKRKKAYHSSESDTYNNLSRVLHTPTFEDFEGKIHHLWPVYCFKKCVSINLNLFFLKFN